MKLLRRTSIKDLSGFLTIYKVAGLAPFSRKDSVRLFLGIYQVLHLVLVVFLFFSAFFIYDVFSGNTLSSLVSGLVFVALSLAHVVLNVQAFCTRKDQQRILDMFRLIDSEFREKLTVRTNTERWNRKYVIGFLVILLVILGNDAIICFSRAMNQFTDGFWVSTFSREIVILRLTQCMHYVSMASERLNLLNAKIEEIVAVRKTTPTFIILEDNYGRRRFNNGTKSESVSIEKILMLKQIFGHIWEVTNIINDCFGWSLLAIVTYYFLDFTSNGYWLFLALEHFIPYFLIMECLCRMIPLAFMLSVLSWVCNNCKQTSETTGCLVHKLEKSTESEQYNALVSEFSLQIMHEPFHISANGFFTIDFELLGSMAAATVTYLVILIQFLLNDKGHKEASAVNATTPESVSTP
ncbi:gustatory receptor 23a-like [Hermetia illucens]|uniref:gustatory receptor 23a-like n=1 Tax=Hermetia illucens TaxID=343691 RepID=UPI0018CBFAAB|nr:gustatory receptor 23a-like [Hermetia illucens]